MMRAVLLPLALSVAIWIASAYANGALPPEIVAKITILVEQLEDAKAQIQEQRERILRLELTVDRLEKKIKLQDIGRLD